MYSAIIKGRSMPTPSIPDAFKLLSKQMQGLGLQMNVIREDGLTEDINTYTSNSFQTDDFEAKTESKIKKISESESSYQEGDDE
jgi:DNA-directed RNA polymerase subunit beta